MRTVDSDLNRLRDGVADVVVGLAHEGAPVRFGQFGKMERTVASDVHLA